MQQKVKFHPAFDDVLRGILSRDAHSIIVLLESTSSSVLFDRFVRSGILSDASVGRVVYLPFMERNVYKTVLAAADVVLDTFPWGGGVTSLEALSVCAPIVVLPRKTSVLHLTLGYYRQLGLHIAARSLLQALVARDVDDYVQKAIRLASSRTLNARARSTICALRGRLFADDAAVWHEWLAFMKRALEVISS